MEPSRLSRRQFVRLGAGVAVLGLGACSSDPSRPAAPAGTGTGTSPGGPVTLPPVPTLAPGNRSGERRLVVVQLNGGNDALNTVPPADGRYVDLRPSLAIPEADRVALAGTDEVALHPSLAGLAPLWEDGRLAVVRGIGFADPNRSHFVSMDRWWRADDLGGPGWLGRLLDRLGNGLPPLYATALGGTAPVLVGETAQPAVVLSPASFRFDRLDPSLVARLGVPSSGAEDALVADARAAWARSVDAVADFATVGTQPADDDVPAREGGATVADGLAVAAQMLAELDTRVVEVSVSGFDTHAQQLGVHASLLRDLADGLVAFVAAVEAAGIADDVLVATTSEFGRRAAENASGGCDHGAGGVSFVLGNAVRGGPDGGLLGSFDLGDLLDGDLRPVVDPLSLFADCAAWLGADPDDVLPRAATSLGAVDLSFAR